MMNKKISLFVFLVGLFLIFNACLSEESNSVEQQMKSESETERSIRLEFINMGDNGGRGMEFQVLIIAVSLLYAFKGNAIKKETEPATV